MWVDTVPPARRLRSAAVIAALLAPVLGTGLVAGARGILARDDRRPAPLVEHSHVIELPLGSAQHLIAPPVERAPSGPGGTGLPSAPPAAADPAPAAAPPPPDPAPAATAAPASPPAAAPLAGLVDSRPAHPRLA